MKVLKILAWTLLMALLTVLTQVGALVLLLWLPLNRWLKKRITRKGWSFFGRTGAFVLFWSLCSLVIIPPIASQFGREALPVWGEAHLKPFRLGYCLLNRHYVRPELKQILLDASAEMQQKYPGTVVAYLDANFPFWNGFRLFPHLSHNDGRKVDLAFFFQDRESGTYQPRQALTPIAYGGSVLPQKGERDQAAACEAQGYWQYSFMYQALPQNERWQWDAPRTKSLLRLLARDNRVGKILLEPHIESRLGLGGYDKIRFHGCQAVRHDDHLHVQL